MFSVLAGAGGPLALGCRCQLSARRKGASPQMLLLRQALGQRQALHFFLLGSVGGENCFGPQLHPFGLQTDALRRVVVNLGDRCHPFTLGHVVAWEFVSQNCGSGTAQSPVVEKLSQRPPHVVQGPWPDSIVLEEVDPEFRYRGRLRTRFAGTIG